MKAIANSKIFKTSRFGVGPHVQWRVCVGKPSPRSGVQAPSEPGLWYLWESLQETKANSSEIGDRYGEETWQECSLELLSFGSLVPHPFIWGWSTPFVYKIFSSAGTVCIQSLKPMRIFSRQRHGLWITKCS